MWKIALRSTRSRFLSFSAAILAVFLGVTFVASTMSLREVLATTYNEVIDTGMVAAAYIQADGDTSNMVTGTGDPTIPLSLKDDLEQLPGVAAVVPDFVGMVVLVNKDGTAAGTANGPPALAYAAYPTPADDMVAGRMPQADNEIALIDTTAEKSKYEIGDTATVLVNGEIMTFDVVGIMRFGAAGGASVMMMNPPFAEHTFAADGLVTSIGIFSEAQGAGTEFKMLDHGAEQDFISTLNSTGLAELIEGGTGQGPDLTVVTGNEARDIAKEGVTEQIGFITSFVLVFAALAVGVSGFVIANTFAMVTRRQQREFAMLRAIGASSTHVFTVVSVQAIVIGAIGSALGIGASALFLQALPSIFASIGMDMSSNASLSTSTVLIGFAVGVGVSFASAAISARRAALIPPVEAMREVAAPALNTSRLRTIVGAVVAVIGAAAATSAIVVARGQDDITTSGLYGVGILAVFVGILVLAAPLSRPFVALLAKPWNRLGRPIVPLASGNVQRTPKRTAATASALIVGVTLTSAAAVVAASVNGAIGDLVTKEMQADYIIQSQTFHIAPSAYEAFKDIDGVEQFSTFAAAVVEIDELAPTAQDSNAQAAFPGSEKQLEIGATEPETMGTAWTTNVVAGSLDAVAHGQAIVQETTAKDNGWVLGDTLTLTGATGTTTVEIGGVINSVGLGMPVIVNLDTLHDLVPSDQVQLANVMLTLAPGANPDQVRAEIVEIAKPYLVLSVFDQDEFRSQLTGQVNQMLAVIYALLGLTVAIAILGIVNTLGLGILERTREIGLLRAIGLSGSQLHSTITLESVLIASFGTLVGLGLGVGVTLGIPTLFKDMGFTELVIPWQSLGVMVVLALVVGVLAAIWPAIRANRIPVLTAISSDE
ncbi:ABC transporter permease [Populibacterium corticicola]|uniref:ABC transporter permease n=1 Tax=Populibacterium corticicola TaxID=1812826 RepID=A0ABW5XI49_9MICO